MNLPAFEKWKRILLTVVSLIERDGTSYMLTGKGALVLQGVDLSLRSPQTVELAVQWDALEHVHSLFHSFQPGNIDKDLHQAFFAMQIDGIRIKIGCRFGTVIRTDPDRISVKVAEQAVYVRSMDYDLRQLKLDDPIYLAIKAHLRKLQHVDSDRNGQAWNEEAYQAWVGRFGEPRQAAEKISHDPAGRLARLMPYLGSLSGKKIINLLGSHGEKGLAMALLGADVTIVDISAENAEYARQTASVLKTPIRYIVSDVLNLSEQVKISDFDIVVMELGILHYFVDLDPLARLVYQLLKRNGRLILQEFHPVSTKLVTTRGKRQVVFGNYFDKTLIEREVAYGKHLLPDGEQCALRRKVYLREWTLGEAVTAFAQAGLRLERLDESPNMKISDIGLPKLFTLVCTKS